MRVSWQVPGTAKADTNGDVRPRARRGHGGWCYQVVAPAPARRRATTCTRRRSPASASARTCSRPDIDLDTHITDVVNVLCFEDLHDVLLVGHSYGGHGDHRRRRPGRRPRRPPRLPRRPDASERRVAARLRRALIETVRDRSAGRRRRRAGPVPGPGPLPTYGLTDPDEIAWAAPAHAASVEVLIQPLQLQNESAVWAIPQTHIVASPPLAEHHPERLAAAREAGRVFFIDTGHDVIMTEPDGSPRSSSPSRAEPTICSE